MKKKKKEQKDVKEERARLKKLIDDQNTFSEEIQIRNNLKLAFTFMNAVMKYNEKNPEFMKRAMDFTNKMKNLQKEQEKDNPENKRLYS